MEKIKDIAIVTKEVKKSWGYDVELFAEIKITSIKKCDSCNKEFRGPEIVYFAPIDNTIICSACTIRHQTIEPRIFLKEDYI